MKKFFAGLFLLSVIGANGAAPKKWDRPKHKGFTVGITPKYKDTLIKVTGWCDKDDLFAEVEKQKGSFFVELSLASAGLSATLVEKYGMKFYHGNEKRIKYVKSTESAPIPSLLTSVVTAKVFISRVHEGQLQVLFTKEDKERLAASLPGGAADNNESILDVVLRELHEELRLKVARDKLRFAGILDRRCAFAEYVSQKELLFNLPYDDQEIVCDGKEVKGFVWENVEDVLRTGKANGLTVLAHHIEILKNLSEGKLGKPCMIMPDHRQLNPKATKNPNDVMIFCPAE